MAGTEVTLVPVAGKAMNDGIGAINNNNNALTASYVNHFRIAACADRLALHVRTAPSHDAFEFFNLCLSLARGIDYAIANKEVPNRAVELPLLLKQVCHLRNDSILQAAVLVLMISVKNACESRWFSDQDCKELCDLANEILSSFCSTMDFTTQPNNFLSIISTVMSRFYPTMKMGEILATLEIKSGYGTYVHDFQISKDMKSTPEERIRLFVAQMDNIENSSCLITPNQANLLLNGKGVERRNNVFMDTGPQIPTPVYHMLKYGTNLLQAVGQFNGHYIIIVAFMSTASTPDLSVLQDYVQPTLSMDSDSELTEGPSRISLNCPISFKRINVPVKGHMCKHLQCFDYENYVDINSRRPSWRCPSCHQYLCFTDIRIDQNVVKVLKEVGENVNSVLISLDGSWKAVIENDDLDDKPRDKAPISGQDEIEWPESSGVVNHPADVFDLTVDDYEMDTIDIQETEDRKVSSTNVQSQSGVHVTNEVNQSTATPISDDFWSGLYITTYGSGASSSRSESQIGGVTEPNHNNLLPSVPTDASAALNQEAMSFHGSVPQSETSSLNSLAMQQFQFGNTTQNDESARFPAIARDVSRAPVAVQALAVQTSASALQQSLMNNMDTMIQTGPSIASQLQSNVERLQHFSRSRSFPLQGSHMGPSTLQQYQGTQAHGLQSQMQSSYRVSSVLPTEHQNSNQQPKVNARAGLNLPPALIGPPASFSRTRNHQGSSQTGIGQATLNVGSQQAQIIAAVQRAAHKARPVQTSRSASPYPVNMGLRKLTGGLGEGGGGIAPPVSRSDVSMDLQAEQNWRPSGRMRGSLSGRAYSEALNQFIIRPTQQAQAATRPPSSSISLSASAQLEILMANRNALAQAGNSHFTGAASTSGDSGVLPERRG